MCHDFIPWSEVILLDGFGVVCFEFELNRCCVVTNKRVCDGFFVQDENIELFQEMLIS